jgi:hypothetical protein
MADYKNCKSLPSCSWRKSVGSCPKDCILFADKDVVTVVRCADCTKYKAEFGRCLDPRNGRGCYGARVPEDHYCGYGERRKV